MSWYTYPANWTDIIGAFNYFDTSTNNIGMLSVLLSLWVVVFVVYGYRGKYKESFAASSWLMFLVCLGFQVMGLVGTTSITIFGVMSLIGLIVLYTLK